MGIFCLLTGFFYSLISNVGKAFVQQPFFSSNKVKSEGFKNEKLFYSGLFVHAPDSLSLIPAK